VAEAWVVAEDKVKAGAAEWAEVWAVDVDRL